MTSQTNTSVMLRLATPTMCEIWKHCQDLLICHQFVRGLAQFKSLWWIQQEVKMQDPETGTKIILFKNSSLPVEFRTWLQDSLFVLMSFSSLPLLAWLLKTCVRGCFLKKLWGALQSQFCKINNRNVTKCERLISSTCQVSLLAKKFLLFQQRVFFGEWSTPTGIAFQNLSRAFINTCSKNICKAVNTINHSVEEVFFYWHRGQ